jgi:hypothetical protein
VVSHFVVDFYRFAIVGDPASNSYSGAAFVYKLTNNRWSLVQKLVAPPNTNTYCNYWYSSSTTAYYYFGNGVGVEGNYAIVGAPGASYYYGAAYVYTQYTPGVYSLMQTLTCPDTGSNYFGYRAHVFDNWAIVGAPAYSSWQWSGAAYIYRMNNGLWTLSSALYFPLASSYSTYALFGLSVAIGNNWAAVGAPMYSK